MYFKYTILLYIILLYTMFISINNLKIIYHTTYVVVYNSI